MVVFAYTVWGWLSLYTQPGNGHIGLHSLEVFFFVYTVLRLSSFYTQPGDGPGFIHTMGMVVFI